jgi:leader peptidase (prepilin peptidase)/N-methyltransferase
VTSLFLYEAICFLLGLLFGSFLNVCISRLPRHESVVKPRSHCPACKHPIRWYDNIPLLSWLLLRGRCRDCKAPISWSYPLVELAVGAWFVIVLQHATQASLNAQLSTTGYIRLSLEGLSLATLGFLLIGLVVTDWQTQLLPDAFTLTGIAIAMFLIFGQAALLGPKEDQIIFNTTHQLRLSSPGSPGIHGNIFMTGPEALIWGRLAAIVGVASILLLIRWGYKSLRHREGLGLGDVKLIAMIAAFLGFWPAILALFLGVISASAYALVLLARGKAGLASKLPLGTFLAIGGLISAQFGNRLINTYMSLLR